MNSAKAIAGRIANMIVDSVCLTSEGSDKTRAAEPKENQNTSVCERQ